MYFNRRAEIWGLMAEWLQVGAQIWGLMAEWLKAGVQIPDDPEIETDLCGVQYGFTERGIRRRNSPVQLSH